MSSPFLNEYDFLRFKINLTKRELLLLQALQLELSIVQQKSKILPGTVLETSSTQERIALLDVLNWRIREQINQEEFSALYKEWLKSRGFQRNLMFFYSYAPTNWNDDTFLVKIHSLSDGLNFEEFLLKMIDFIIIEFNTYITHSYLLNTSMSSTNPILGITEEQLTKFEELYLYFDDIGSGIITFDKSFFVFLTLWESTLDGQNDILQFKISFNKFCNDPIFKAGKINLRNFMCYFIRREIAEKDLLDNFMEKARKLLVIFARMAESRQKSEYYFINLFESAFEHTVLSVMGQEYGSVSLERVRKTSPGLNLYYVFLLDKYFEIHFELRAHDVFCISEKLELIKRIKYAFENYYASDQILEKINFKPLPEFFNFFVQHIEQLFNERLDAFLSTHHPSLNSKKYLRSKIFSNSPQKNEVYGSIGVNESNLFHSPNKEQHAGGDYATFSPPPTFQSDNYSNFGHKMHNQLVEPSLKNNEQEDRSHPVQNNGFFKNSSKKNVNSVLEKLLERTETLTNDQYKAENEILTDKVFPSRTNISRVKETDLLASGSRFDSNKKNQSGPGSKILSRVYEHDSQYAKFKADLNNSAIPVNSFKDSPHYRENEGTHGNKLQSSEASATKSPNRFAAGKSDEDKKLSSSLDMDYEMNPKNGNFPLSVNRKFNGRENDVEKKFLDNILKQSKFLEKEGGKGEENEIHYPLDLTSYKKGEKAEGSKIMHRKFPSSIPDSFKPPEKHLKTDSPAETGKSIDDIMSKVQNRKIALTIPRDNSTKQLEVKLSSLLEKINSKKESSSVDPHQRFNVHAGFENQVRKSLTEMMRVKHGPGPEKVILKSKIATTTNGFFKRSLSPNYRNFDELMSNLQKKKVLKPNKKPFY